MEKLKQQKYLMNGIHGFILLKTKLKILKNLKNLNGKNLINLTPQVLRRLTTLLKIKMELKKNTILGKIKIIINILIFIFIFNYYTNIAQSEDIRLEGNFVEIKILDKVSSKNSILSLKIGKEKNFENLNIKFLKCKNSEFDDSPEITAYMQVKDITDKDNDKVFVFNDWTFSSSPSLRPFDHPVYDIWLTKCY